MKMIFKPSESALILIDLQNGIVEKKTFPISSNKVIKNAISLVDAFRAADSQVIYVTIENSSDYGDVLNPYLDTPSETLFEKPNDWSSLVSELNIQPNDLRIIKKQWGAFYGTDLDLQLRRRGIKNIILGGLMTNIGVESTARDAYERGYNQVFVTDAMGSNNLESHSNTLKYIFSRIGILRTTQEVIQSIKNQGDLSS